MDINNDLQQINTFIKGMNTDVSDALMDSSQYRYAENVRLATNTDENTGELRLIEGNALYSEIPENVGSIIAMTNIRHLLIIITRKTIGQHIQTNGQSTSTSTTIDINYILVYDTNTNSGWRIVFKSKSTDEPFGQHLSLVTRWENEKDIKLYIADGVHSLMYINLYDNGTVLEGMDAIKSNLNTSMNSITAELSQQGGTLPPVKVQYAYRLYKEGGAATGISPLSNIVTLYNDTKGYEQTSEYTNKAVDVKIQQQENTELNYIQLYRISYQQIGQQPKVDMIYDSVFKTKITDFGTSVESISFEEFLSMFYQNIYPKVIESKGDYLFAANIHYEQDDIDKKLDYDKNQNKRDFRIYSSGDSQGQYNRQFDNISQYNIDFWKRIDDGEIVGGNGTFINWQEDIKTIYCTIDNKKYKSFDPNTGQLSNRIYEQLNSLRQGEVYRYGAIFYDEQGKKSSVKWLCDIMVRPLTGNQGFKVHYVNGNYIFEIKQIGIDFTVHTLPDGFSGVEIVRCNRTISDKITYIQGIAGFPYKIYSKDGNSDEYKDVNTICAPYILSTDKFYFTPTDAHEDFEKSKGYSDNTNLVIASPEYSYQPDDIENMLAHKTDILTVRPVRYLYKNTSSHIGYGDIEMRQVSPNSNYWQVQFDQDSSVYQWVYNKYTAIATLHPTGPLYVTHSVPNVSFYNIVYNIDNSKNSRQSVKISDISFTNPPSDFYQKFLDNTNPNYRNSSVNIGNVQYINWSIPLLYGVRSDIMKDHIYLNDDDIGSEERGVEEKFPGFQPSGSTGKYIIVSLDGSGIPFSSSNNRIETIEVNIRNENATPYGGYSTVNSSQYISYGFYRKGTGDIRVFDGDCYPGIFEFNVQHAWYNPEIITKENRYFNGIRQASVCYAPIESDIDLSATYGSLYSRQSGTNRFYFQDDEASFDEFTQSRKAYLYNTGYGIKPDSIQYSSIYYSSVTDDDYDSRVYHSELKTNGESIDKWLQFKPLNYIDVDSRFGQITNMRLFKDKLMFWQEHATGILSVNERTVINDLQNNDIVVGTGGTLQRSDYISTVYGMKADQYEAEIQTNYSQYWWDGYNKEILVYTGGMELVPLTKTKGLTNYINQREEQTHPVIAFDSKYDEVLSSVVKKEKCDETLVYNEQIQAFQSIYTFEPKYRATIGKNLYLSNDNQIYIQNKKHTEGFSYLFNQPAFPKIRIVINKNNIYNKTFDNLTFGGRIYRGSVITKLDYKIGKTDGIYIKQKEHVGESPMQHLQFFFSTPLKQRSAISGDNAVSVNEYDFRLAIPRNGQNIVSQIKGDSLYNTKPSFDTTIDYGNRMKGKTMQCEIASDYNSTDFSLQYITTKFRMSWS